jgi:hypothetical protein
MVSVCVVKEHNVMITAEITVNAANAIAIFFFIINIP